jgi:hypothetical protein
MFFPVTGDENRTSVKLHLPMTGTDGSTVFSDTSNSPLTITRGGNPLPTIVTAQSRWGQGSGYFPQNTSGQLHPKLQATLPSAISGLFTFEVWVRPSQNGTLFLFDLRCNSTYTTTTSLTTNFFIYRSSTDQKLRFAYGTTPTQVLGTVAIANNEWSHVAASRDSSNTVRLFLNGTIDATVNNVTNNFSSVYAAVGGACLTTVNYDRWLQDARLDIGLCRYTSDFTVPNGPLAVRLPELPIHRPIIQPPSFNQVARLGL